MSDTDLWKACIGEREVRARTRDIHARQDSSDIYGVELRITRNGELYLSEVFRDRRRLHARSMKLFELLVQKGWTATDAVK